MPMKPIQIATIVVAGLYIMRITVMVTMMAVEMNIHDDDDVHLKHPDRSDRRRIKMDFNHTDNLAMIEEGWKYRIDLQGWVVLLDFLGAGALILGLPILLTVKQHFKRTTDEKELLMTVCLSLGTAIPVIMMFMLAGPRSYGAWIARTILDGKNTRWSHFDKQAWQSLEMSYGMVESLKTWVLDIDLFLMSIGILLLVFLGKQRAPHIVTKKVYSIGAAIGCLQLTGCLALAWREAAWMPFQILAMVCVGISFVFLLPAFFIFLGIELGKTDSLEELDQPLMAGGGQEMPQVAKADMEE